MTNKSGIEVLLSLLKRNCIPLNLHAVPEEYFRWFETLRHLLNEKNFGIEKTAITEFATAVFCLPSGIFTKKELEEIIKISEDEEIIAVAKFAMVKANFDARGEDDKLQARFINDAYLIATDSSDPDGTNAIKSQETARVVQFGSSGDVISLLLAVSCWAHNDLIDSLKLFKFLALNAGCDNLACVSVNAIERVFLDTSDVETMRFLAELCLKKGPSSSVANAAYEAFLAVESGRGEDFLNRLSDAEVEIDYERLKEFIEKDPDE